MGKMTTVAELKKAEPLLETITLLQDLLGAVECEPSGHEELRKRVEKASDELRKILGVDEKSEVK